MSQSFLFPTRRDLLRTLVGSVGAAALGPPLLAALADRARGASARAPGSRKLLLLWLEGGPSQLETFDPKPGAVTGGPLGALGTDQPDWFFSETLPGLARRAEKLCVVRSMTSKEGNHARARMYVHTGYVPNPSVAYPTIGSIVSSQLSPEDAELPGFVQIEGAPGPASYLGIEHVPFVITDPEGKIDHLAGAPGVDSRRLDHRVSMLDVLEAGFEERGGSKAVQANRSLRRRARRMMNSRQIAAFDLEQEKESTRDAYGRNKFGQGCLLARRLLEAGVSAVEVVLGGWDTHDDAFQRTRSRCELLDPAFSQLLDEMGRSGLLDETLILCLGEFGRTPRITATDGRGHWPSNWCAVLAGAGISTGQALGRTDETGESIVERPISVPDLYATVAAVLGFDAEEEYLASRRPITLVDAAGTPIPEILGAG